MGEVGRAVYINYGPMVGRIAVIVEIINTSRVLIEGPTSGVRRQEMSLRRLSMTDFVLDIPRSVKSSELIKAVQAFDLNNKWNNTPYGRRLQRASVRGNLTDFDRFKVMVLRKRRTALRNKALAGKK